MSTFRCCGGYGEHFDWCQPTDRLVLCHCHPAYSELRACDTCDRAELHAVLLKRGAVQDNPIVVQAYDALAAAYEPTGSRLEDIWVNGWHQ